MPKHSKAKCVHAGIFTLAFAVFLLPMILGPAKNLPLNSTSEKCASEDTLSLGVFLTDTDGLAGLLNSQARGSPITIEASMMIMKMCSSLIDEVRPAQLRGVAVPTDT